MESSQPFIFFPHLTSNCWDSKYGGEYGEEDRDRYLQKALHRHPETTAALKRTVTLFEGTPNISWQRGLPSPLARGRRSAQHGGCTAGHASSWDRRRSCALLSPALRLLLGDSGRAILSLRFPNGEMERRILPFAEIFWLRECRRQDLRIQYLSARQRH